MNFSPETLHTLAVLARLSERLVLLIVVVAVSLLLMAVLWKRYQKLAVSAQQGEQALQMQITFAMPVFLLLGLGLFSWVAFSHPIEAELSIRAPSPTKLGEAPSPLVQSQRVVGFAGADGILFQSRMNALVAAIAALKSEDDSQAWEHANSLIGYRNEILLEHYGQNMLDICRNPDHSEYGTQTCQNIRRWES